MPSREPELYKDKIEVSLDGRQIFYLFFGGAVIVGLVFVLGVMVGRRVEARGHLDRADTSAARDPLAALDRLERTDNLSFHGALTGTHAPTDVEKAIGELEKRRTGGAKAEVAKTEPVKVEAAKPEPVKVEAAKPEAKAEAKAEAVKAEAKAEAKAEKRDSEKRDSEKRDSDKRDADKHDSDKHDGEKKPRKHDVSEMSKADAGKSEDARSEAKSEAKTRFTLQLSSFQDRGEAEAFLGAVKSSGFQPYLTEAEVTGKGTFYRIRLGSYRSLDAANDAKAEYEKSSKKSAQVMRL